MIDNILLKNQYKLIHDTTNRIKNYTILNLNFLTVIYSFFSILFCST